MIGCLWPVTKFSNFQNDLTTLQERIVIENESWVWLVPYWAIWPYETMLLPKKHTLRLQDLSDQQRNGEKFRCL